MPPTFSVVIPAYNQAEFLTDAVQSILDQTVQDFEILIVNDASTDHTAEVIAQFDDSRIVALDHSENRGLPAARNTGMAAARGEFIALLDADDYYDPRKFEMHLQFLRLHPEISITYNARYQLHFSAKRVRDIYLPPATASLSDFVLGFPFSPSDMLIRREAAARVGFFDAEMRCGGEDVDFPCRLALEGFRFARVEGVLNYRRFHAGRKKKKLRCRFGDYTRALDRAFQDPRCPESVLALRSTAYANHYIEVACWALAQGEIELGNEIIQEILLLDPTFGAGHPSRLISALYDYCIRDESLDHERILPALFQGLPATLQVSQVETGRLVAKGYLAKGTRSALWGDDAAAEIFFKRAAALGIDPDPAYPNQVAAQLGVYEAGLGLAAAVKMETRLLKYLRQFSGNASARAVAGCRAADRAFTEYGRGNYPEVIGAVSRAIFNHPGYLLNRGIISITLRSLWRNLGSNRKIRPGSSERLADPQER